MMSQPNGANYVVLYQMLCLKTINSDGKLSNQIGEVIIPYDVEKIRRTCKYFSADTVRVALNLYKSLGLIYEDVDGTLMIADHGSMVGSETDAAARMRNSRANRAALPESVTDGEQVANIVTPEIRDKEIRDKRLDTREREVDSTNNSNINNKTSTQKPKEKKADAFEAFASGDALLLSALRDFEQMRKSVKKPMTDRAKQMLVNKLQRDFSREDWIPVLEQSILNSWLDIWPLKTDSGNGRSQSGRQKAKSGVPVGQCAGEGDMDEFERRAIEDLQKRMQAERNNDET